MPLNTNTSLNRGVVQTLPLLPVAGTPLVISPGPGRLISATVTVAGTGNSETLLFDNASTNAGNVIGRIPGNCPVGTVMNFLGLQGDPGADFGLGLTAQGFANGPTFIVSYM